MSTSVSTGLSKPEGDAKISVGTLSYVNTRTLLRAYTLVVKEMKQSGVTQAQLARRLGKAPEVISRLLNRPTNLELKTLSELLFAISGSVLTFAISRPLDRATSVPEFYKIPHHIIRDDEPLLEANLRAMPKPSNLQIRRDGIGLPSEVAAAA